MAKRKKAPPKVKQTAKGVQVTYPGRTVRTEGPDKAARRPVVPPVRCPYCEADGRVGSCQRIGGLRGTDGAYYECLECCDPEKGRPTRFKVLPA